MKRSLKNIAGFGGGYRSKNQSYVGVFFGAAQSFLPLHCRFISQTWNSTKAIRSHWNGGGGQSREK